MEYKEIRHTIPKELRYNKRLVWYWPCNTLCESAVVESTSNLPNNPIKSFKKVVSCYRAAGNDTPLMGLDCREIQCLGRGEPASAESFSLSWMFD